MGKSPTKTINNISILIQTSMSLNQLTCKLYSRLESFIADLSKFYQNFTIHCFATLDDKVISGFTNIND